MAEQTTTEQDQSTCAAADRSSYRLPVGGGLARSVLVCSTGLIAVLTFAFSFGNVWSLDLLLGIEPHIAPLVGPAVDLSVIGLLVTVQWLALAGVSADQLHPARRLLAACGVVTMALNSALSLTIGVTTGNPYAFGRAAAEAIAPWLLIAWSHVGPIMLRLFVEARARWLDAATTAERARLAEAEAAKAEQVALERAAAALAAEIARAEADKAAADAAAAQALAEAERAAAERAQADLQAAAELAAAERAQADRIAAEVALADRTQSRQAGPDASGRTTRSASRRRGPVRLVQSGRLSMEDRTELLDRTYPDRIPGRNEVMRDLDWSSASETSKAIAELRARREQSTPADGDRADEDDRALVMTGSTR